jgi:hypothetical protein
MNGIKKYTTQANGLATNNSNNIKTPFTLHYNIRIKSHISQAFSLIFLGNIPLSVSKTQWKIKKLDMYTHYYFGDVIYYYSLVYYRR